MINAKMLNAKSVMLKFSLQNTFQSFEDFIFNMV